jgi:hypothetical protein
MPGPIFVGKSTSKSTGGVDERDHDRCSCERSPVPSSYQLVLLKYLKPATFVVEKFNNASKEERNASPKRMVARALLSADVDI